MAGGELERNMNNDDFNKLVEIRIAKTREVLFQKNKEYSSDTDRLHNFKVAARIGTTEETPEQALLGMWRKHLVSILDLIDMAAKGEVAGDDFRSEKIGDTINYLILLEALLAERAAIPPLPATQAVFHGTNAELRYKAEPEAPREQENPKQGHLGFSKCSCAICQPVKKP